jgi:hypothetical protein
VQSTKAEADRRHPREEWDGATTEQGEQLLTNR